MSQKSIKEPLVSKFYKNIGYLLLMLASLLLFLSSCKVYKIDSTTGKTELTNNAKMFEKGHPKGYFAKGKWHSIYPHNIKEKLLAY